MDSKLSKKGVLPGRWSTPEFISLQYGEHSGSWGMAEKVPVEPEKLPGGGNDAWTLENREFR